MEKTQRRFRINDLSEIIVGSVVLAFPVAITEEVWNLGTTLPLGSAIFMVVASLVFTAWFAYHAYDSLARPVSPVANNLHSHARYRCIDSHSVASVPFADGLNDCD